LACRGHSRFDRKTGAHARYLKALFCCLFICSLSSALAVKLKMKRTKVDWVP
jgi:hypothetical protein